ncbi:MAG TPA: serine/threonine-protein kinase [Pyrinomonadaceae bacterium]
MPPHSDPNEATVTGNPHTDADSQQTVRAKENLIGVTLGGRYLIEKVLAQGGMGAVYLARDKPELLSRRVVVKVLLEDSLKDEWVVKKFRQEIESLTRLDDPCVVGIFDAGTLDDGSPYLVMQYVDGVNLRSVLKPEGIAFERAANIIKQVGRALTTAHNQEIVHRDLKPENIMLRSVPGDEEQVKVIDFGIAKIKNSAIAPTTLTGANVAGTVAYMSPEQLEARSIAAASDIYALGAIAYEMLAGRRPFNPETPYQLAEMQREGVKVSPKALRPAIPAKADELILKALSYSPAARPQRARDFGDELARALTEGEESTIKKQVKPVDKKLSVPLWMIAALVLLAAGIVVAIVWLRSGSESKQQSDAKSASVTPPVESERKLTYSLTVQKMEGKKAVGDEYPSTGQEIFGRDWKFRMNITPAQSGSLYMLSEVNSPGTPLEYNALFPTPQNNDGLSKLAASQKVQTGRYFFDKTQDTEKFWIIWSAQPIAELETIFKEAASHDLIISDPAQTGIVRELLVRYEASKPVVEVDKTNKQVTLKGKGDLLISLLELKH